ncbi:MAG: imidazole glycerol phosphate synthase cyclase subunit [Pseudomonadota bacterium]|nr:imidazole glycerol phosphate synthase cyclase subunit [Pseudomonadota bacterium]
MSQRPVRLIARLDIKGPNLIKGVRLEGLRVIGDPQEHATRYYEAGADELVYMDIVASLYGRNSLTDVVRRATEHIFVPITVGGGVRSIADAEALLRAGADKVAVNTAALARPELLTELSRRFGSQCVVLSVEAKRRADGGWEAYTDNGREHSGRDVIEWVRQAEQLGAGEILLTSVDQEGTRKGFDIPLLGKVTDAVEIPVIASGGLGAPSHLVEAVRDGHADAVAVADALHYRRHGLHDLRETARAAGIPVREAPAA